MTKLCVWQAVIRKGKTHLLQKLMTDVQFLQMNVTPVSEQVIIIIINQPHSLNRGGGKTQHFQPSYWCGLLKAISYQSLIGALRLK